MIHFFGQFHPAIVHFPVALLIAAMLFEVASWLLKNPTLHHAGVWNLHLGAISALVTTVLGWALAATMGMEPELRPTLLLHRWLGTGSAVWAVICLYAWYRHWKTNNEGSILVYRFTLLVGGALVGFTGHFGGLLVYGLDFYTWTF